MIKRTQVMVGVMVAVALVAAGCGTSANSGGSDAKGQAIAQLRVGSGSVPTLDYTKSAFGYHGLGNLILEPLLIRDPSGELKPWLAESWEQPTPTTYVYRLRKGVEFSNGNELTAEDVAFALNIYRQPGSTNAYNFPPALKSIEATDRYTVRVTLSEPNAAWALVPARNQLGIFEKSFYEKNKSTYGQPGTGIVGTGPWKLDTFDPTSAAKLSANPAYWGGRVPIQSITWTFFSSETSAATAFRAKQLDVYFPQGNRAFASTANTELITAPDTRSFGQFSMNTLVPPWNDLHVRRAVAYALDKQALIEAWGGYARPSDYFIPPKLLEQLGSTEEVEQALADVPTYPHDLAKAKAEMAKSAFPNGVDVTLMSGDSSAFRNVSQALVAQLAKIGIRAKLDVKPPSAAVAQVIGRDRKAVPSFVTTVGGTSADPGAAYDFAIGSANAAEGRFNTTNWSTPKVDKLIADGFSTTEAAKRLDIYAQLNREFADNVPFVPLFLPEATLALSSQYSWPTFNGFFALDRPWALGIGYKK